MKIHSGLLKIVSIAFAFLISFSSFNCEAKSGINDNYLVNSISMSEGLPADFVDYIYRDSNGFVWIATSGGGLSRFDGADFMSLTAHSVPSLKSSFVTCVTEDHFRRLWVASESGIDIVDLNTLSSNALCVPELSVTDNHVIRFITTDYLGNIWVKYSQTIYCVRFEEDGAVKDVLSYSNPLIGLQDNFIKDIDADGSVWTSFGSGVVKLIPNEDGIMPLTVIENLPIAATAYVSDCILKNYEVWVSTSEGLFRYNKASGNIRHYQHSPYDSKSLSQNFLTALGVTWDEQIVISSLKGLNIYDPFNDCFERVNSDRSENGDLHLSSDFINCISTFDEQLWIGTESAGIVVVSPKLLGVKNYVHNDSNAESIARNPVNSILSDKYGRIWTGNVEAGLSWTYPESGSFHHITTENSSLVHNSVSALECDDDGNLWVGTWGGGISILSLDGMKVTRSITASPSIPISYIGVLKYDPVNNYMWIGSNAGIFVYDPSSENILPVLEDQPFGSVGAAVDERGRMWMGCQRGLYLFDLHEKNDSGAGDLFSNRIISPGSAYSDRINCVSITSDGVLWVGSNGNGVYRLDSEGEDGEMHFSRFTTEQGLANDRVKGILDDNFGRIWISTDNGLSRFNPKTEVFTNYYTANGLSSSQFYWNASARIADGTLCFGHMNGLSVVTPEQEKECGKRYDLSFTSLSIGDREVRAGEKYVDKDIACADVVKLHQRDKSVGFEFALLDYGTASPAIFSYRLKGFDDDWITLRQNRRFVSFTNLPAGNYTLQVRAMDSETHVLGENEVRLSVARYFYKSWWFVLMALLLALNAVVLFVKLRTRHLSRQREELQDIVMERTREISEQKKLLELKAEELAGQNRILARQNEELAGQRILFSQELRQTEVRKDDRFVEKLIAAIRENYKNPELDVAKFCEAMGMSKTLLNKKLQDSLGQSIGQFIRTYRLSIAREMLINNRESKSLNISEIAYEVGFNDPKYFTRCFTKEYGTAPSSFSK